MSGFLKGIIATFLLIPLISFGRSAEAHVNSVIIPEDSMQIRDLLTNREQEIKDLLGEKGTTPDDSQREKLKDIINNVIDYGAMAQFALQQTFDTLSLNKRSEFVDVFAQIVRDQSLRNLDIYRAEITYNKINVNGDSAWVETMSRLEDVRTPVYYVMKEMGENWKVVDFYVDNVSTAKSYRRSFQNVIRRKGFDYLLETLKKRANSN